jgi:uncharacterized membrane protein
MNLEDDTSFVLRYGVIIGVVIIVIGVILHLADLDIYEKVMFSGIAIIVFTPFAGMFVSFTALTLNKERTYALAAAVLIFITVIGMVIGYYLG